MGYHCQYCAVDTPDGENECWACAAWWESQWPYIKMLADKLDGVRVGEEDDDADDDIDPD